MEGKKKIHNLCEGGIEKYVPLDHLLSLLIVLVMPNSEHWDRFFYLTLTFMIDYYYNFNSAKHYMIIQNGAPSVSILFSSFRFTVKWIISNKHFSLVLNQTSR